MMLEYDPGMIAIYSPTMIPIYLCGIVAIYAVIRVVMEKNTLRKLVFLSVMNFAITGLVGTDNSGHYGPFRWPRLFYRFKPGSQCDCEHLCGRGI